MPRIARLKSEDSIYHIMVRSIKEIDLFKEEHDKERYLGLIKKYQRKLGFKVYAYCLMDNHGHIIVDSNGTDISKIMHGVNFSYAMYYNRKYKRYGHVFQDRFKSKIIKTDKYLVTLSAYIHSNCRDIKGYESIPQKYKYSSLGIYLDVTQDQYEIIDKEYLMGIFNLESEKAKEIYLKYICEYMDEQIMMEEEFLKEKTRYVSGRVIHKRDYGYKDIIEYVSKYTQIDQERIFIKNNKKATKARAIAVFLMRRFCNFSYKQICTVVGNITYSRVSNLSSLGLNIILEEKTYEKIINDFIYKKVV